MPNQTGRAKRPGGAGRSAAGERAEIAEQAARLRLALARTARRLRQSAGSELGPSATAALASVERLGPLTPSELADVEVIKRPTATRIIGRLEEHGLVARSPDPEDGRCALISVTTTGRALLGDLRRRKDAYLASRLAGMPATDLATLNHAAAILERMLEQENG